MKANKIHIFFTTVIFLLGSVTCVPVGELQENLQTVELGGAQSAEVELSFNAGEIEIRGGSQELMEGVFEYNVESWRPEVNHQISDSRAFLSIRQGDSSGIPAGKGKNFWDIYLNEKIPLELAVDVGAGGGDLNLQDVNLRSLNIDIGVGDLRIDLAGKYTQDVDVYINGGVGSTTLFLPRDFGVLVNVDKGIGSINSRDFIKKGDSLVNEVYGDTDVEVRVYIDTGIGSITLRLR